MPFDKDNNIVLVVGTFNITHAGHCRLLEYAAQFGKVTVGINSDDYLRKKYGDKAVPLVQRAYVLQCNKFVDRVIVFREDEPSSLIYKIRPDVYVKGPDYSNVVLPEEQALKDLSVKVLIHQAKKIQNSSDLVETFEIDKSTVVPNSIIDLEESIKPLSELFPIPS